MKLPKETQKVLTALLNQWAAGEYMDGVYSADDMRDTLLQKLGDSNGYFNEIYLSKNKAEEIFEKLNN